VLLDRQVQRGVGGIQVGMATAAVRQSGYRHLAEHGGQPALMSGLDAAAGHPLGVGHLLQALLALRPQVQVILHQLTHQFTAPALKLCLQLGVFQPGRLGAIEEARHRLE
jgi:hypothetical protein